MPSSQSISRFISILDTSSIKGSDNIITAHAYRDISIPTEASVSPKSFLMSVSKPIGTNSDVLKINVAKESPSNANQFPNFIFSFIPLTKF